MWSVCHTSQTKLNKCLERWRHIWPKSSRHLNDSTFAALSFSNLSLIFLKDTLTMWQKRLGQVFFCFLFFFNYEELAAKLQEVTPQRQQKTIRIRKAVYGQFESLKLEGWEWECRLGQMASGHVKWNSLQRSIHGWVKCCTHRWLRSRLLWGR